MTPRERIESDLIAAQKSRAQERVNVLRLLISEIKNKEIEKRGAGSSSGVGTGKGDVLDDAQVIEVLRREVKKRSEAIELFKKGNRADLAAADEADILIINAYLPPLMNREDIVRIVDGICASGTRDFPSVMREAMKTLKGKADGALVKEVIESCLKGS